MVAKSIVPPLPTIFQCTITGNSVSGVDGEGGGIFFSLSSPTIANCIISDNTAKSRYSGSSHGGEIYCVSSSPTITNSILYSDEPDEIDHWDSTFSNPSGETKTNSMTIIDGTVVFNEGCLAIGE